MNIMKRPKQASMVGMAMFKTRGLDKTCWRHLPPLLGKFHLRPAPQGQGFSLTPTQSRVPLLDQGLLWGSERWCQGPPKRPAPTEPTLGQLGSCLLIRDVIKKKKIR